MNAENFCTYEQCLKLKELGFEEECFYHYKHQRLMPNEFMNDSGNYYIPLKDLYKSINSESSGQDNICDAPTLYQAKRWLLDNHKIFVTSDIRFKNYRERDYTNPEYEYIIVDLRKYNRAPRTQSDYDRGMLFSTPEKALSMGISECLKLLDYEY